VPIRCAEQGSGTRPSEDRIFITDQAVIVLDGAAQPQRTERDGGWIADRLGAELAGRLEDRPNADLGEILASSIREVAQVHDLRPGEAPSTTVVIVRWDASRVDALVLCDSLIVARDHYCRVHQLRDDRLSAVTDSLDHPGGGLHTADPDAWRALVDGQRSRRNMAGGYWVAEAVPEAAYHAVTASWPADEIAIVMAMTDGVSIGVDRYGIPPDWSAAIDLAADDPARLINAIHDAEADDPAGQRWPRSKVHDDKALAVLRFDLATPR
jgi:hypothetical protein